MAKCLKVAAISSLNLSNGNIKHKRKTIEDVKKHWEKEFEKVLPDQPDLIVLPEACDEWKQSEKKLLHYYENRGSEMLKWFSSKAKECQCYIACSMRRVDSFDSNSIYIIDRKGKIAGRYNKNHPVITENTQLGIAYNDDAPLIQCDFGSIGCAICFDLNFTENLLNKYIENRPDIIIFSSAYHGGIMQNYWRPVQIFDSRI